MNDKPVRPAPHRTCTYIPVPLQELVSNNPRLQRLLLRTGHRGEAGRRPVPDLRIRSTHQKKK